MNTRVFCPRRAKQTLIPLFLTLLLVSTSGCSCCRTILGLGLHPKAKPEEDMKANAGIAAPTGDNTVQRHARREPPLQSAVFDEATRRQPSTMPLDRPKTAGEDDYFTPIESDSPAP